MAHRRFIIGALVITVMLVMIPCIFGFAENLLENGDFELLDEEDLPEGWYTDAYVLEPGYTVFSVGEADPEGSGRSVGITNIGGNDARFAQTVEVEPESLYCLSGDVLAENVEGGHGANLSVEGIYAFSEKLYDTDGQWIHIEYYGETGPDQDWITVFARLGGYSGESTGKAAFRNLSLVKVDSVPGDAVADLWYRETAYEEDEADDEEGDDETGPFWPWLLLISLFYITAAAYAFYLCRIKATQTELQDRSGHTVPAAVAILLCSLLLRVILSWNITGYMVDVNCFLSWGHTFASSGPAQFYQATSFCDYPPLYTYVLGLNSKIASLFGHNESAARLIFRMVPNLCDLAACWILFRILIRTGKNRRRDALFFLAFISMNPAMIINSAAWGQMDGVLCLLLMGVALLAIKGKWIAALPLYVVSVLVKPQALMLGPLGLTYIIQTLIREPKTRKPILIGTGLSLLTLAAGVIPFSINQNPDWLIQLYGGTLASYPYATVNTANLYYLLGGNWSKVETAAHLAAGLILSGLSILYAVRWIRISKQYTARYAESAVSVVFAILFIILAFTGASWSWVGGTAMAFAFVVVLSQAIRGKRIELLAYLGALLYILLYVFGVKMHERYLFPSFLLLAAALILLRDRRILYVFVLFTVTLFINEGIVLDNSIRLGSSMGHLNKDTVWLADAVGVLNILGALYAVYLGTELLAGKAPGSVRTVRIPERLYKLFPVETLYTGNRCDRSLHWNLKDTVILASVTTVFAAVSLLTLGSTKAPQTAWTASSNLERIVFDLGKEQKNFSILYFGQVSRNDFTVAVSNDGETWSEEQWAQMDQGQCWKWKYVTQSIEAAAGKRVYFNSDPDNVIRFSGRYIRLSAQNLGLTLNELLFRNETGEILPAKVIRQTGAAVESELYSDPENLLDEQDAMEGLPVYLADEEETNLPAQPGWWNSSYFDEIYHARTAFEFLKGTVPYETSHPPLGKVLMSAFIAVFGMTPFGWRFAGALAGILMLPGMYLLGKQLTKKTGIAALACLLMALDCMHLTQTQIATIDSFPVLFIIFAYFFMLRFLQTDIRSVHLRRILPDLALSGLFMGLSIASKWIGVYAGGGLAILFLIHCFRAFRDARTSGITEDPQTNTAEPKETGRKILLICLWCILFFIIVPVVIYLLSYIPYMAYNSRRIKSLGDYIAEVWRTQLGMFSYHSTRNLGVDHPFYSPWWEWPIIGKPMYYASEQYVSDQSRLHHSIFAFGNPVIWFGGLAAILYCLIRCCLRAGYALTAETRNPEAKPAAGDSRYLFLFIGLLAQYLPWVLVPRGTYIYHYFASLPFLMLAVSVCFDGYGEKNGKIALAAGILFIAASAVMFIILFPYASGINASVAWLDIGRKLLRIWY